jgi:flagellar protein FlaG
MNDITKVAAAPVAVKLAPASPLSNRVQSQKTGNDLPPVTANVAPKAADIADTKAIEEHVQAAVAQMNEYIQSTQRDLHFSYDANSGETVVKVLDRNTQEVIRQIPDEIFLRLAQQLDKNEPINFFNAKA